MLLCFDLNWEFICWRSNSEIWLSSSCEILTSLSSYRAWRYHDRLYFFNRKFIKIHFGMSKFPFNFSFELSKLFFNFGLEVFFPHFMEKLILSSILGEILLSFQVSNSTGTSLFWYSDRIGLSERNALGCWILRFSNSSSSRVGSRLLHMKIVTLFHYYFNC